MVLDRGIETKTPTDDLERASTLVYQDRITKFTGEISKWQEFWSQYEAAIHSKAALFKKKFAYLKTYLADVVANASQGSL